MLRAQEFWRTKFLAVDLVILNEADAAGTPATREAIDAVVLAAKARPRVGTDRGETYALHGDAVTTASGDLLRTAARAVLTAGAGSLGAQLAAVTPGQSAGRSRLLPAPREARPETPRPPRGTEYFNGLGGFVAGGREYVTVLDEEQRTPAPWVNVIANEHFGCQVSTDGACSTWSQNAPRIPTHALVERPRERHPVGSDLHP